MSKQKLVKVYGTGKGSMNLNEVYEITNVQADKLIKQGFASNKQVKQNQS